jgi:hypothetical protein
VKTSKRIRINDGVEVLKYFTPAVEAAALLVSSWFLSCVKVICASAITVNNAMTNRNVQEISDTYATKGHYRI